MKETIVELGAISIYVILVVVSIIGYGMLLWFTREKRKGVVVGGWGRVAVCLVQKKLGSRELSFCCLVIDDEEPFPPLTLMHEITPSSIPLDNGYQHPEIETAKCLLRKRAEKILEHGATIREE